MTAMVSAMVMASSWSWVTWTNVIPTSVWILLSSICICRRSLRSRAPSGSSRSSTCGRLIRARASATRCCCPPESWPGRRPPKPAQLHHLQHLRDLGLDVLLAATLQPEGDVLGDGQVREERVVLEDGVDRTPVGLEVRDVVATEHDRAVGRLLEAGDHAQRGRLAAPGRAEQGEELARPDEQVEVVDRGERAEPLGDAAQLEVGPVVGPCRPLGPVSWARPRGRPTQAPITDANCCWYSCSVCWSRRHEVEGLRPASPRRGRSAGCRPGSGRSSPWPPGPRPPGRCS